MSLSLSLSIYIYIYIHVCTCIYIYVMNKINKNIYIYICIYVILLYTHICLWYLLHVRDVLRRPLALEAPLRVRPSHHQVAGVLPPQPSGLHYKMVYQHYI